MIVSARFSSAVRNSPWAMFRVAHQRHQNDRFGTTISCWAFEAGPGMLASWGFKKKLAVLLGFYRLKKSISSWPFSGAPTRGTQIKCFSKGVLLGSSFVKYMFKKADLGFLKNWRSKKHWPFCLGFIDTNNCIASWPFSGPPTRGTKMIDLAN